MLDKLRYDIHLTRVNAVWNGQEWSIMRLSMLCIREVGTIKDNFKVSYLVLEEVRRQQKMEKE